MDQETGTFRRLLLTGFEPFGEDTMNPSKELVQALDGLTIGRWKVTGMVLPVTYGLAAAMVLNELGYDVGDGDGGRSAMGCGADATVPTDTGGLGGDLGSAPTYDVVLSLGQAKGRDKVCLERVAINIRDAGLPDHAGHVAQDEPIVPDGPAAYFTNLPLRTMKSAIEEKGVPVAISNTAGTYVCNDLLYLLLHFTCGRSSVQSRRVAAGFPVSPHTEAREHPRPRVGFIHLPALPEQVRPADEGHPEAGRAPSLSFDQMKIAIIAAIETL